MFQCVKSARADATLRAVGAPLSQYATAWMMALMYPDTPVGVAKAPSAMRSCVTTEPTLSVFVPLSGCTSVISWSVGVRRSDRRSAHVVPMAWRLEVITHVLDAVLSARIVVRTLLAPGTDPEPAMFAHR